MITLFLNIITTHSALIWARPHKLFSKDRQQFHIYYRTVTSGDRWKRTCLRSPYDWWSCWWAVVLCVSRGRWNSIVLMRGFQLCHFELESYTSRHSWINMRYLCLFLINVDVIHGTAVQNEWGDNTCIIFLSLSSLYSMYWWFMLPGNPEYLRCAII